MTVSTWREGTCSEEGRGNIAETPGEKSWMRSTPVNPKKLRQDKRKPTTSHNESPRGETFQSIQTTMSTTREESTLSEESHGKIAEMSAEKSW